MAIQHVVYFKFKQNTGDEDIKRHMEMFAALREKIPGIVGYSAGKTFSVEYETTASYDVMHILTCESKKALEGYFFHPDHQAFIETNKHIWEDVLVLNADL